MEIYTTTPIYMDYIWGGTKLKQAYGAKSCLPMVAESWNISAYRKNSSGLLDRNNRCISFYDYVQAHPDKCCAREHGFPQMMKLIDAAKSLSVQVHPDDVYAAEAEGENGKTEMWVILEAERGAFIYFGFQRTVTRDEVRKRVEDGTLTDILKKIYVKPGDVYFIEAGTVHAIGAGILLAEIQQNSNSTYRLYDFGRLDADGKPRPLHIEKALDVMTLTEASNKAGTPYLLEEGAGFSHYRLAECDYFCVEELRLHGCFTYEMKGESFLNLLCVDGAPTLYSAEDAYQLSKGDTLFLPKQQALFQLKGEGQVILSSSPTGTRKEDAYVG